MGSALKELAAVADEVADEQRRVARLARTMERQRDAGWSWARILDREPAPGLLELLRASRRRLASSASRLTQTLAFGLAAEGESRRQVARRLAVSHQRVSAIVKNGSPADAGRHPAE